MNDRISTEVTTETERGYGSLSRNPFRLLPKFWSGRPDSNRRRPAWEYVAAPQALSGRVGKRLKRCPAETA